MESQGRTQAGRIIRCLTIASLVAVLICAPLAASAAAVLAAVTGLAQKLVPTSEAF
jgi:hypothetical protein